MSGGTYATLSFVLEFGVPLAILYGLVPIPGLGSDQRKHPQPALLAAPEPVETIARPSPGVAISPPQVAVAEAARTLEPV